MKWYVGTSGWSYPWNPDQSLDWYAGESGLNAIELNFSFYRFPTTVQVSRWAKTGRSLDWSVKVNRSVTHGHLLNAVGLEVFDRFLEVFSTLDPSVSYYLFQFPKRFTTDFLDRLQALVSRFPNRKMAFEFRHPSWYLLDFGMLDFDGAIVTPDSPDVKGILISKNRRIYLRFHGRNSWYSYSYSKNELAEIAGNVASLSAETVHAFFNNNHNMLENARMFQDILKRCG